MISSCFLGEFISESEIIRFEWSCRHTLIQPSEERRGEKKDFLPCLPLNSAMIQGQIKILALFLSFLFVVLYSFVSLLFCWKLQSHSIFLGIILASVKLSVCQHTGFSFWFSKECRQVFNLKHILRPPVSSRALKPFVLRSSSTQEWAKLLILGMWVLYTSRSPSLIYQMPQLFSNFTRNFWMFFTFIVEGKKAFVFHYIFPPTPSLFLHFLKLLQHVRTWVTLSLGADFLYQLPDQFGMQDRLLFYQLPPGSHPSAVPIL